MGQVGGVEWLEGGKVTGAFTASGQSGNKTSGGVPRFKGVFNIAIWGTFVASIALEKSFDEGATWLPVGQGGMSGAAVVFTSPLTTQVFEPEGGMLYRLNCTWTSGTANYRISQ